MRLRYNKTYNGPENESGLFYVLIMHYETRFPGNFNFYTVWHCALFALFNAFFLGNIFLWIRLI